MKISKFFGLYSCAIIILVSRVESQVSAGASGTSFLTPSAALIGKHYVERIGYALAGGGDVNGDGFDDLLIGAFHNSVIGLDAGAVYLFLGRARLPKGFNISVDSVDAQLLGQTAYEAAGYSIACNGDLNGDGFDDLIIGAPAGNDAVPWMVGQVYILFGKAQPDWGFYSKLSNFCNAIFEAEAPNDLAGLSVACVGDVNGDGYDDFLVGAPFSDEFATDAGKAYFLLGHPSPWIKTDQLAYAAATFYYTYDRAQLGYTVAGIGDINNDHIPDFAISAPIRSCVFIIYGRKEVNWGKNFNLENADLILYGNYRYDKEYLGWKVAGGGDVNGDGISDVIISSIANNDAGKEAGKVYVLFGKNKGWATQELFLKDSDASFLGEEPKDQAGWGLAMVGDIDSDGYDDFLIGTFRSIIENTLDSKTYLIRGKSNGWKQNISLSSIPDTCARSPEGMGNTVAAAGDFDNDGIDDFLIAAPFNSDVQRWSGKVYLFASQQIPYRISGTVNYYSSNKSIPGAVLQADTLSTAIDTTDIAGNYQLSVSAKRDYTVHIKKDRSKDIGSSITAYDAALIARLALELDTPNNINIQAADVYLDGHINMYDAANTLRYAVQLPPLADSHAGEWMFIPISMFYDSIITDQFNQNYTGYIRGDVDVSWQYPGSALLKTSALTDNIGFQVIQNGEELVLPLNYHSNLPLLSLDLELSYDQHLLEFLRIETTAITSKFQIAYNNNFQDRLLIGAFTSGQICEQGRLLSIVFKVKNPSPQQTEIVIQRLQINNLLIHTENITISFDNHNQVPQAFRLQQNYPNPFNNLTQIPYEVSREEHVEVVVYNNLGKVIKTLIDGSITPGKYLLTWDGKDENGDPVASGIYICKASHPSGHYKIKIIYMK